VQRIFKYDKNLLYCVITYTSYNKLLKWSVFVATGIVVCDAVNSMSFRSVGLQFINQIDIFVINEITIN